MAKQKSYKLTVVISENEIHEFAEAYVHGNNDNYADWINEKAWDALNAIEKAISQQYPDVIKMERKVEREEKDII